MDNQEPNNDKKEIDLIELFKLLGQGIKNFVLGIYDAMWWLLAFGIKKYLYVLILGLIGLSYGIYHAVSFVPGYESQMMIRTNALRSYDLKPYFEEITTYLSERTPENSALVEDVFNLDSASLSKIISIDSYYYVDVHGNGTIDNIDKKGIRSLEDTINIRDSLHLCISALVNDPAVFPKLNSGIQYYIESRPFLQKQNAYRLEETKSKKEDLKHETDYLDSLQQVVYFNSPKAPSLRQTGSGFYLGNVSVQLFHYQKEELKTEIKKIEKELILHRDIYTVLSDFKISTSKTTSNVILMIKPAIYMGFLGYVLALLIYIFGKNYKKYAARIE